MELKTTEVMAKIQRIRSVFTWMLSMTLFPGVSLSQTPDLFETISMDNISGFRPDHSGDWRIVKKAYFDYQKAAHPKVEEGKGALLYSGTHGSDGELFTNMQHGDIDIDMDIMLSKGSGMEVYFQGRYGIRIPDHWGTDRSSTELPGSIIQSNGDPNTITRITPPRSNAGRAPGLWQNLKISFIAPRYNDKGEKISNAIFKEVIFNGSIIHQNIEVANELRSKVPDPDKDKGPLVLLAHSPVAVRNLRYKRYEDKKVQLRNIRYSYYQGKFNETSDFSSVKADQSGPATDISWTYAQNSNQFALRFDADIIIPAAGTYLFTRRIRGKSKLMIDNITLTGDPDLSADEEEVIHSYMILKEGAHRFSLIYIKALEYTQPNLGVFVEGPMVRLQPLQAAGSWSVNLVDMQIAVDPADQPVVQRCFFADKSARLTYCVAVGTPQKLHYACDLSKGRLLKIWKGEFLDATKMWKNRGAEQVAVPRERPVEINTGPLVASLPDQSAGWPEGPAPDPILFKGYTLNAGGYPAFRYIWHNNKIEDEIFPSAEGNALQRILRIKKAGRSPDIWLQLDRSGYIEYIGKGLYAVNDRCYYIRIDMGKGIKPVLRRINDHDELLVHMDDASDLKYSIIW